MFMRRNDKFLTLKKIDLAIRKYRLEKEIEYHKDEISKREPKVIGKKENVFSKISKSTQNQINKTPLERNTSSLKIKEEKLEELLKMENDEKLYLEEEKIEETIKQFFEDDKYGLGKLEFAMSVIQDSTVDFEINQTTFEKISAYLGYDYNYLSDLEDKMKKAYLDITGKTDKIVTAVLVGSIFAAPVIVHGALGTLGAALSFGIATPLEGIGFALGSALVLSVGATAAASIPFGITYGALSVKEKTQLKKSFAKLSVEETAVSLLKTCFMIKEIAKFKEEDEAKRKYEEYIEQYVDLKSDVDIRLFLSEEDKSTAQNKNILFARCDKFLFKSLNLA